MAAALILLAAAPFLFIMSEHHDVTWQLWIGRQLLHGAGLYTDILEINPPLWFWLAVPINWLSEWTGIPDSAAMVGFMVGSLGLSLWLVSRLIEDSPKSRAIIYAAILLVSLLIPLTDFGQREHFALIAAFPYTALIARRLSRDPMPLGLAVAIGLFAALGFALKHYFALVPIGLELLVFIAARQSPFRPETVALGLAAAIYGLAILLFAPAFLTDIVPMIRAAYHGYEVDFSLQFRQQVFPIYSLAIGGFILYGKPSSRLAQAAAVASAAFLISYFLQNKGWRYHALPATGLMIVAVAAEWNEARFDSLRKKAAALLFSLALAVPFIVAGVYGTYSNGSRKLVDAAVQGVPRGESVIVLTANASNAWPMVEEHGLVWPSRHFTFWMLPAIARGDAPQLADRIRRETAADLLCHPPRLIMVADNSGRSWRDHRDFDVLGFFLADPDFAGMFSHYRYVRTVAYRWHDRPIRRYLDVYQRDTPLPALGPCRRIW